MARPLIQIIRAAVRRRRQASLWLGVFTVGLLLWGKLLLKDVPRTAVADEDRHKAAQADNSAATAQTPEAGHRAKSPDDTTDKR